MNNKFVINKNTEQIEAVENETTISFNTHPFRLGRSEIYVLITQQKTDTNGENYFNIYVIDDRFKIEPSNCLQLQEPTEAIKEPKEYFNNLKLEIYAINHYLWNKYSTNEKVLSFDVVAYSDDGDEIYKNLRV